MPAQQSASLRIFELGVLRRSTAAKRQPKALFHRHPWRQGRRPWCRSAAVFRRTSTSSKTDKEGRHGCLLNNPRPCGFLSLAFYGGVPPQNASLKLYSTAIHGGRAAGRGVEVRRYSAALRQALKPTRRGGMDACSTIRVPADF